MQQTETTSNTRQFLVKWGGRIAAIILWLLTSLVGLLEILFISRTSVSIYTHFDNDMWVANFIGDLAAILTAVLCLGFIIFSMEYHRKHVGQASSWTLFGWTIAIELLILILYFVV